MIRPNHFGFNEETAESNSFQHKSAAKNISEKAKEEFDRAVNRLIESNIEVKIFEDQEYPSPDAVFSNNWIASLPSKIITIFPMATESRRKEVRQEIVEWVYKECKSNELIDLTSNVNDNKYLEGTGSIVFDHQSKIAYACESVRTNIALFEKYCKLINYTPFSFESLDLKGEQIYHTNVMMSISERFAIVNFDSVQNQMEQSFLRAKLQQSGKELIEISYPQMNGFAANVFEVLNRENESCLVMSEQAHSLFNQDQLDIINKHSKIVIVDIAKIEAIGGGGIRCMLIGIFV